MDKKDVMYLVAALAVVLVIALVIKPMVTGHPVNTGIPVPTTTVSLTPSPLNISMPVQTVVVPTTIVTTKPTTPVPTWNPNASHTVDFVNPADYGVSLNQSLPAGTRFNETTLDMNMTTFSTISSSSSGTTGIFYMPFPYWELVYTVEPKAAMEGESSGSTSTAKVTATPTSSNSTGGVSHSGITGSFSTAKPQLTIQVMDGDDPNRIVRTITPPGGIDLALWTGATREVHENSEFKTNQLQNAGTVTSVDPRPWTEKFYEGQRRYFFIINAQSLDSYTLEIKVPTRYIGHY